LSSSDHGSRKKKWSTVSGTIRLAQSLSVSNPEVAEISRFSAFFIKKEAPELASGGCCRYVKMKL
jgi:hypothetical protein